MTKLRIRVHAVPPAARTAFRLNQMAARGALEAVAHPVYRPHNRRYDSVVALVARSVPTLGASPEPLREALDALTAVTSNAATRRLRPQAVLAGGVPGIWVQPAASDATTTILYLHGGGYVCGSPRTHLGLLARLADVAHAQVLGLDYRLAPEAVYPAAVVDAWSAYWWLLAQGVAPASLFLAGDSAGGGLCVALLVALRDAGLPLPAGALLFSPWVDLAFHGGTVRENAPRDWLNELWLRTCAAMYLGDADATTPLASPLYADLHGLPPLLIQVGTAEMLLDDAMGLARRAVAAGTDVELELWENMIHVWQMLEGIEPKASHAVQRVGQFVRRQQRRAA